MCLVHRLELHCGMLTILRQDCDSQLVLILFVLQCHLVYTLGAKQCQSMLQVRRLSARCQSLGHEGFTARGRKLAFIVIPAWTTLVSIS